MITRGCLRANDLQSSCVHAASRRATPQCTTPRPRLLTLRRLCSVAHSFRAWFVPPTPTDTTQVREEKRLREKAKRRAELEAATPHVRAALAATEAHIAGRADVLVLDHGGNGDNNNNNTGDVVAEHKAAAGLQNDDDVMSHFSQRLHSSSGRSITLHTPRGVGERSNSDGDDTNGGAAEEGFDYSAWEPADDSDGDQQQGGSGFRPRHKLAGIGSERRGTRGVLRPSKRGQSRRNSDHIPTMVEVATMMIERK